ncbi:MAG: deaminase [Chitinophagaceae bacterium]
MAAEHEKYMNHCLELAAIAKEKGKTAVGSIIVKDRKVIAAGSEGAEDLPDIMAHAEIIAIINAIKYTGSEDLSTCTLYTTVEPCFMCSYLIRKTKIKKIIFGAKTNDTGGVSSSFPILRSGKITCWSEPPQVIEGILREECEKMLEK